MAHRPVRNPQPPALSSLRRARRSRRSAGTHGRRARACKQAHAPSSGWMRGASSATGFGCEAFPEDLQPVDRLLNGTLSMAAKGALIVTALLVTSGLGCAAPKSRSAQEVKFGEGAGVAGTVSQAELQQDLQRFAGTFMDRVAQAMAPIQRSGTPDLREEVLRRSLLYATSILDIVSEPQPELALLDTIVFIVLCREVLESYWLP